MMLRQSLEMDNNKINCFEYKMVSVWDKCEKRCRNNLPDLIADTKELKMWNFKGEYISMYKAHSTSKYSLYVHI